MRQSPLTTMRACAAAAQRHTHLRPPHFPITRRRVLTVVLSLAVLVALAVFVLPRVADLGRAWDRLGDADPLWLYVALGLEVLSFAGYTALFHSVFGGRGSGVGWRESYEIPMAGLVASRVLPGAGGVAFTAWALRRSGMEPGAVAQRLVAFLVLLDGLFLAALALGGLSLGLGLLPGPSPWTVTVLPALLALGVAGAALALLRVPPGFGSGWRGGRARAARALPAIAAGERTAWRLLRSGELGLLGSVVWWMCDVGVLWACFRAFGEAPPLAVVVVAYFVGMLATALPLPAGIGGVEGGLIGAFLAFGVEGDLAVVAVLVYRTFAYWLPTLPGLAAYVALRRDQRRPVPA